MSTYSEESENFYKGKDSQFGAKSAKELLRQIHLVRITEDGDLEYYQGFNNSARGIIKKEAISLYLNRFDWESKCEIEKHLEEK